MQNQRKKSQESLPSSALPPKSNIVAGGSLHYGVNPKKSVEFIDWALDSNSNSNSSTNSARESDSDSDNSLDEDYENNNSNDEASTTKRYFCPPPTTTTTTTADHPPSGTLDQTSNSNSNSSSSTASNSNNSTPNLTSPLGNIRLSKEQIMYNTQHNRNSLNNEFHLSGVANQLSQLSNSPNLFGKHLSFNASRSSDSFLDNSEFITSLNNSDIITTLPPLPNSPTIANNPTPPLTPTQTTANSNIPNPNITIGGIINHVKQRRKMQLTVDTTNHNNNNNNNRIQNNNNNNNRQIPEGN